MFRPIHVLLAASLVVLASAPAVHGRELPLEQIASVRVDYSDLDLSRESDSHILLDRLERAAYVACGGAPSMHRSYELMPRFIQRVYRECRENAVSRALTELNRQSLWTAYASRAERGVSAGVPLSSATVGGR